MSQETRGKGGTFSHPDDGIASLGTSPGERQFRARLILIPQAIHPNDGVPLFGQVLPHPTSGRHGVAGANPTGTNDLIGNDVLAK